MPFGDHWEWRGFGRTSPEFRAWFQTLPPYGSRDDTPLHDEYLWTPGCVHNVKLRYNALKLKRFLARAGEFERWLEDEKAFLPFPLDARHLDQVATLLNVRLPAIPSGPVDRDAFLALMARAQPPVHRVTVVKQRALSLWRLPDGEDVVVEWTRIHRPRRVITVGMEHADRATLARAYEQLSPRLAGLQAMNYLQAIALWVQEGL